MKRNIYKVLGLGVVASLAFASCSDEFLEDKKNYDNVTPEVYEYESGMKARVADIYAWCLTTPNNYNTATYGWKYTSNGMNDDMAKATEEYSGFSNWVNPEVTMSVSSSNEVYDFFGGQPTNIMEAVYGRIRNINDCIEGIKGSSLPNEIKDKYLGQVLFWRAYCYLMIVKYYGGIPLVTELLDPVPENVTPRSSTKATFEFIISDLDEAARLLEPTTGNGGWNTSDYGRITNGAALALKGRAMLLWASPLFNRANDQARWTAAYDAMTTDLPKIQAAGHGLYNKMNNINGSTFANLFSNTDKNPEALIVTLRNNIKTEAESPYNEWEQRIRPRNTGGISNYIPSQMIIDLFPMSDGKRPNTLNTYTKLAPSDSVYDQTVPFVDRDPRFYRTFAFPGFRWAYNGDPTQQNANNPSYSNGKDYELWSYVWYTEANDAGNTESGESYGADNLLKDGNRSVYLRKRSDDADVNSPLYNYDPLENSFRWSAAPFMEMRYAEVLLNYAEAACMAGHMDVAVEQLKAIRERAGYTAENNYGLQTDLAGVQATCMSAILYERQIEFAYEGKRFDDCRRWMLYDGGTTVMNVEGAPETWRLTGWGGNTCDWLGVKPLNGQRRENIEFRVADKYGVGGTTFDSDPLVKAGVERCAAVDLRKELGPQIEVLRKWYKDNLTYKVNKGDSRDSNHDDLYMEFKPQYYFLGFKKGIQNRNTTLPQNIGWEDTNTNANGTFDPLAE